MESPDIVVHSLLATYKLFKVFHCAHEGFKHGGVIVKLFIPHVPEEDDFQESIIRLETILKPYRDATFLVQCRFWGSIHPNAVPYESAEILGRSAILMRQYFGRNLFDRIYTLPPLSVEHKKWFAVQILAALAQMHSAGVIHGDIKSENVFVVGSFQVLLTDFATFIKPVYLPLDDPVAATSLFFESGVKRRRCFIAPERFIDSLTSRVLDEHGRRMTFFDKEFTQDFVRMDLFSCGLCIAELFLDGQHVVDLPELLAYRTGCFDLASVLDRIPVPSVQSLVKRMTERDPNSRPNSAIECLRDLLGGTTTTMLTLMTLSSHAIYANPDMRMMLIRHNWGRGDVEDFDPITELEIFQHCLQSSLLTRGVSASIQPLIDWCSYKEASNRLFPHPNLSDKSCKAFVDKLMNLWSEGSDVHLSNKPLESIPEKINQVYSELFSNKEICFDGDLVNRVELEVFLPFLGSTAMACSWSRSKLVYIDMISDILTVKTSSSQENGLSDRVIADQIIPYMHDLILSTSDPLVKVAGSECLSNRVVNRLQKTETGLFSEYLFPLCLGLDHPCSVPLAAAMAAEAVRLSASQADQESKKLIAIGMFAERVVMQALGKGWYVALAEGIEILNFVKKKDFLRERFSEILMRAPLECAKKFTTINIPIPYLTACVFQHLERHDTSVETTLGLVSGLASVIENRDKKSDLIDFCIPLIRLLEHWSAPVRNFCRKILICTLSEKLTLVDQFVFLRKYLPKGCRTLPDILHHRFIPISKSQYEQSLSGGSSAIVSVPARQESAQSVSSSPGLVTHSISVQVLNPLFQSPRPLLLQSSQVHAQKRLSLRNFKDWKTIASGYPSSNPSDLGCLSNMDGSLRSLYSPASQQSISTLQARLLSAYPCVALAPATSHQPWKPESLLLATLSDFAHTSVVSVDTTDDGRVIVAAGADRHIRVWRTNALETEAVIQPFKTVLISECSNLYCAKTLRNTKSVVLGNDNSLLVYRLDVGGDSIAVQSDSHPHGHPVAIDCFDTDFTSTVLSITQKGYVLDWDVRTNQLSHSFSIDPLHASIPSGLVISKDALTFAVSTIAGNIHLFDYRFLKPLRVWSISSGLISRIAHSAEPQCVWVASGSETCLFDIHNGGDPKHVLSVNPTASSPSAIPFLDQKREGLEFAFNDVAVSRSIRSESTSRCILEFPGAKSRQWSVLTGHNDGTVRHWTPSAENAGIAFPLKTDPPVTISVGTVIAQTSFKDTETEISPAVAGRICSVTEGHRDAVTDLCIASLQYDIVVTSGRDGLIKLWK